MLSLQVSTAMEIAIDFMSQNVSQILASVLVFENVFMGIRRDVAVGIVATDT